MRSFDPKQVQSTCLNPQLVFKLMIDLEKKLKRLVPRVDIKKYVQIKSKNLALESSQEKASILEKL